MPEEMIIFRGFEIPKQNWSKLPHEFIDNLHRIDSLAELKAILYILRHTWGFGEYGKPKKLTIDEFCFGRKRRDGSRMDGGTGMTEPSVRAGLDKAAFHQFVLVEVDARDLGRVKKYYSLNIRLEDVEPDPETDPEDEGQGEKSFTPEQKKFSPRSKKVLPPSEKETPDRNSRVKTKRSATRRADELPERFPIKVESLAVTFMRLTGLKCESKSDYVFWVYGNGKARAKGFTHMQKDGITSNDLEAAYKYIDQHNRRNPNNKIMLKAPNSLYTFAIDAKNRRMASSYQAGQQPEEDPAFDGA